MQVQQPLQDLEGPALDGHVADVAQVLLAVPASTHAWHGLIVCSHAYICMSARSIMHRVCSCTTGAESSCWTFAWMHAAYSQYEACSSLAVGPN